MKMWHLREGGATPTFIRFLSLTWECLKRESGCLEERRPRKSNTVFVGGLCVGEWESRRQ